MNVSALGQSLLLSLLTYIKYNSTCHKYFEKALAVWLSWLGDIPQTERSRVQFWTWDMPGLQICILSWVRAPAEGN